LIVFRSGLDAPVSLLADAACAAVMPVSVRAIVQLRPLFFLKTSV
jgi:hypothetical protein